MTRGPRDRFPTEDATGIHDPGAPRSDDFDLAALLSPLDDRSGPARRLTQARSNAMVRSIMDAALEPAPLQLPEGTREVRPAPPPPRRGARVVALLAAAMVVTIVGGAAAAVYVTQIAPTAEPIPVPAIHVPAPRKPTPKKVVVVAPEPDDLDDLDAELAEESLDMPAEVVRRKAPAADRELPDDAPPQDILKLANQRRKEKRWRDADALYRRVMVQYKGSDAAVVATVSSADLHLERLDDAAGALRRYRRALRVTPSGDLAEESRWGVAEALRSLGDADAEAEALRAFLANHPGSANAPAAQRRLTEIAAP